MHLSRDTVRSLTPLSERARHHVSWGNFEQTQLNRPTSSAGLLRTSAGRSCSASRGLLKSNAARTPASVSGQSFRCSASSWFATTCEERERNNCGIVDAILTSD